MSDSLCPSHSLHFCFPRLPCHARKGGPFWPWPLAQMGHMYCPPHCTSHHLHGTVAQVVQFPFPTQHFTNARCYIGCCNCSNKLVHRVSCLSTINTMHSIPYSTCCIFSVGLEDWMILSVTGPRSIVAGLISLSCECHQSFGHIEPTRQPCHSPSWICAPDP
jgi:hypothetical protein